MGSAGAALGAHQLGELLAELAPLCVGLRVREASAQIPHGLLLVLEPASGAPIQRVLISADPNAPRLHAVHGRLERHRGPVGPFFERATKALEGAVLLSIEQPRSDRIALLRFAGGAEPSRAALVAELTGRHANLLLLDGSERLLEALVPPRTDGPGRLTPGRAYEPPPGKPTGDGTPLSTLLPEPGPPPRGTTQTPLSWRVEVHLGGAAEAVTRQRGLRDLAQRLERRLGKARGLLAGLAERERAAALWERVREDGELLKANLASAPRGTGHIEVEDWFHGGAPRRIELDPKLGPAQNLERIFERSRKLARSQAQLERERELALAKVAALEGLLARAADGGEDPEALESEAVQKGLLEPLQRERGKAVQVAAPRLCYRRFLGAGGGEILVGRSAKDNDELTFRVARGNDLWLHTADAPGSHVVLRVARGGEPHPEDLLDAAHLAVHFSPQKGANRANVHVAPRKAVHKPKGAPPGLVTLSGGRNIALRMEPQRLARLLGEQRGEPGGDERKPGGPHR